MPRTTASAGEVAFSVVDWLMAPLVLLTPGHGCSQLLPSRRATRSSLLVPSVSRQPTYGMPPTSASDGKFALSVVDWLMAPLVLLTPVHGCCHVLPLRRATRSSSLLPSGSTQATWGTPPTTAS